MKRTNKRELCLNNPLIDLNKSSVGCAPCLNETFKIKRRINERSMSQIKIEEIKKIVDSIFETK